MRTRQRRSCPGRVISLLVLLIPAWVLSPTHAAEVVHRFHADIVVQADGDLLVTETITVQAEGKSIRRGIYRDLISTHTTLWGGRDLRRYEILEILRDGGNEPWHTARRRDHLRIYIGRKDRQLKPGKYTYTLRYRAIGQVRHFDDHDELYWNVNGNRWSFPFRHISARVELPASVPANSLELYGYSGAQGKQYQDFRTRIDHSGETTIQSTRPYRAREGLTLSLSWEPGHVDRPTTREKLAKTWQDNRDILLALCAVLITLVYFLLAWLRVGRDPRAGPLVPHYEPDPGYSPAAMRYIRRMGYDDKTMAAAVVNLAAQGHIEISEERQYSWGKPEYTVARKDPRRKEMAAGEKALYSGLLGSSMRLTLDRSNTARVRRAREKHLDSLQNNYEKIYFRKNYGWTGVGFAVFAISMVPSALAINDRAQGDGFAVLFALIWTGVWGSVLYSLAANTVNLWRNRGSGVVSTLHAIVHTAILVPFASAGLGGLTPVVITTGYAYCAVMLCGILTVMGFYHWMKAPSRRGRALLDHVEGFREYLTLAEADELRLKNPPKRTPELFERFLPYAIALDVEDAWGASFADALHTDAPGGYRPTWYHGGNFSPRDLGATISNGVTSAVATSSGSSSGGGGGGSSGGGGGGGGGGGW